MKLRDLGEFAFIDRIAPGCVAGGAGHVLKGIGDDAAVIELAAGIELITTDLLIEGVHFLRSTITPHELGYKALAVNLSDIAAMGGTPRDALVSIAVPPDLPVEELEALYAGIKELARAAGVSLLGGDTTGSPQGLCIGVVVTGTAPHGRVLYRSGARTGDRILVTGTLGDAAGGLEALVRRPGLPPSLTAPLIQAHVRPELYLEEARIFAASGSVHAAIDLSDGLGSDLRHVCRASGVGALIVESALPISEPLRALCRATGGDPVALAVGGGEDYRLLITVDPGAVTELGQRVAAATGRRLYDLGEIVPGAELRLSRSDGSVGPLPATGWDHFAAAPWAVADDPRS